jgi:hypothetical protein
VVEGEEWVLYGLNAEWGVCDYGGP